ncbi:MULTISPECIES: hypothetical protein [unclassified Bradyrhizobium]|uniref:hypothetical protein n=1 Tax=unclassified Bradyrhizobium TaxID=2631580 RepID=UPI0028E7E748|nr:MULTISPECIES: hypothetical protein [unclassified Bradyrhizobium]
MKDISEITSATAGHDWLEIKAAVLRLELERRQDLTFVKSALFLNTVLFCLNVMFLAFWWPIILWIVAIVVGLAWAIFLTTFAVDAAWRFCRKSSS